MSNELREIQESIESRLSQLNKEKTTMQARLSEVEGEISKLDSAADRFHLLSKGDRKRVTSDGILCMWCFVFHGSESMLINPTVVASKSIVKLNGNDHDRSSNSQEKDS